MQNASMPQPTVDCGHMLSALRGAILDRLAQAPFLVRQLLLGTVFPLTPQRLPGLLPLLGVTLRDLPRIASALLPSPEQALKQPDGLCGLAGRVTSADILAGYRRGMFVMSHIGPLKWWAPAERMVLFFDQARVEKTVRRLLRNGRFQITFDRAFSDVMSGCASPRPGCTPLTWITPRMRNLFDRLHTAGHAHSVEAWDNGQLVGGVYGLAVGRVFFTESQFHLTRDASKVAFAVLNRHLQSWGFALNDGKRWTRYLADCGMTLVPRRSFSKNVDTYCAQDGHVGAWNTDASLLDDRWEPTKVAGISMQDLLGT